MLALLALPYALALPRSQPSPPEPERLVLRQAPPAVARALDELTADLRLSEREQEAIQRVTSAARVPLIHGRLSRDVDLAQLAHARAVLEPLWHHLDERRDLLARATDWSAPGLWKRCEPERWVLQLYDRACLPRERRELAPLRSVLEARLAESLLRFDRRAAWEDYARLLTLEHRLPPLARHYASRALPHCDWLETLRERLGPPPAEAVCAVEGGLGLWLADRAGWRLAAERTQIAELGCLPSADSGSLEWVEVARDQGPALLAAYDEAIRVSARSLHERWRHRWTLECAAASGAEESVLEAERLSLARHVGWHADYERWIRETRRLLRLQSEAGHARWREINDPYRVNQVFGPGPLRSVPRATPPAATGSRPG